VVKKFTLGNICIDVFINGMNMLKKLVNKDIGRWLTYISFDGKESRGKLKSFDSEKHIAWIVFLCNDNWDNNDWKEYTANAVFYKDIKELRISSAVWILKVKKLMRQRGLFGLSIIKMLPIIRDQRIEAAKEAWDNGYQCGYFRLDLEKSKQEYLASINELTKEIS
jgi:hypothetical protein